MFRHQQWVMEWIAQIESVDSYQELEDPGEGIQQEINNKIAVGLLKVIHGEFRRKITTIETNLEKENKMLNGRQIAWLIYHRNRSSEACKHINSFQALLAVELRGDNLQAFRNDWEMAMQSQIHAVDPDVAQAVAYMQLQKSDKLKEALMPSRYNGEWEAW